MDILLDEVESLEAILMDDVRITRKNNSNIPELIETTVLPNVGEDTERQYVCVTLQVMPIEGYPDVSPQFKLKNPRGLDDHCLNSIEKSVKAKLQESIGLPVVFDLIDVIREHLTSSNLPSGQCVVCLYGFRDGDEFTRTECYHFLHSYCLARHLIASKRNYQEEQEKLPAWQRKLSKPFLAVCPVCRETINDSVDPLTNAKPPTELENAPRFQLTNELKILQSKMANLFIRQKNRGGIIDLNAVDNTVIGIDDEEEIIETKNGGIDGVDDALSETSAGVETPIQTSHSTAGQQQQNQQANNITNTPNTPNQQQHSRARDHHHHHRHHRGHRHHGRHYQHHNHGNNADTTATATSAAAAAPTPTSNGGGGGGGHNNHRNNRNRRGAVQNQQPCTSNPR